MALFLMTVNVLSKCLLPHILEVLLKVPHTWPEMKEDPIY